MPYNPFESLEQRLQALENKIEYLTECLQSISRLGNENVEETIGGIELAIRVTKLSRGSLYNLISQRKIPHFKRGKKIYFDKHQLISWIQSGKRQTLDELRQNLM